CYCLPQDHPASVSCYALCAGRVHTLFLHDGSRAAAICSVIARRWLLDDLVLPAFEYAGASTLDLDGEDARQRRARPLWTPAISLHQLPETCAEIPVAGRGGLLGRSRAGYLCVASSNRDGDFSFHREPAVASSYARAYGHQDGKNRADGTEGYGGDQTTCR